MTSGPNDLCTSWLAIIRELEASLARLATDYVDLYQLHSFDVTTPLEETLRALDDLVRQGKARYIGLSNFAAWQIAKADGLARRMGTETFCSIQAYCSLVGRELEREIIPTAMDLGLGMLIDSPLDADADGDGLVSLAELQTLYTDLPEARLTADFDLVDIDGDGLLNDDEIALARESGIFPPAG